MKKAFFCVLFFFSSQYGMEEPIEEAALRSQMVLLEKDNVKKFPIHTLPLVDRPENRKYLWSRLHSAALLLNLKDLKELLACGARVNSRFDYNHTTPLHSAISETHKLVSEKEKEKEVVRLLLEAGASTAIRNSCTYELPIHRAAEYGHDEVIELLASYAETSQELIRKNRYGKTPLDLALAGDHYKAAWVLIKMGVEVSESDRAFIQSRAGVPGVYVDLKDATTEILEAPVKSIEPLKSTPHLKKYKSRTSNPILKLLESGAISVTADNIEQFEKLYKNKEIRSAILKLAAAKAKNECAVCLDTITEPEDFSMGSTKCMHFVCKKCRAKWRKQKKDNAKLCAVCR